MFLRSFLFLIMLINFMGCSFIHKTQSKKEVSVSLTNQDKSPFDDDEKVWVEAQTQKVWVNDHVDESGDMVEGHYKHIIVNPGHWAVKDSGKK